ncbi:hypothetical protein HYC85_011578 [Camellia sinensis]|uniref:Uncharacterized protein n=1 Tax=Camellia sinensis TaxID=4442 RepID=A0A7J7HAE0_CAMSI|nr:hypothetical protein HYC85_011578 [Camellia sinensis]
MREVGLVRIGIFFPNRGFVLGMFVGEMVSIGVGGGKSLVLAISVSSVILFCPGLFSSGVSYANVIVRCVAVLVYSGSLTRVGAPALLCGFILVRFVAIWVPISLR